MFIPNLVGGGELGGGGGSFKISHKRPFEPGQGTDFYFYFTS